jgi:hypothetical protein
MTDKLLALSRKGYLTADILTDSYRISGEVNLKGQPLLDTLNDKMSNFIRLENLYVSPVDDPTIFKAQLSIGFVRKTNIIAVILAREEDGLARHTMYSMKADAPILFSLYASLSSFELRGGFKLSSPVDIENMLMQGIDAFVPVFRAELTLLSDPQIRFTGGAVLLNREYAHLFSIEKITTK